MTLTILELRIFSLTMEQETLTLLRTLPTLWRMLVATSAMPATREASASWRCIASSLTSASLTAVKSLEMPVALPPAFCRASCSQCRKPDERDSAKSSSREISFPQKKFNSEA